MRSLIRFAALIAALMVASGSIARANSLVIISIDGMRPSEITGLKGGDPDLPNLRGFLRQGSYAESVRNETPTLTLPNHVSLVTGVAPEEHGVVDNLVFDPLHPKANQYYWYAQDIRTPTLWTRVKQHGGTVASVNWPVTVGAADIDFNIPLYWRDQTLEDVKLIRALSTPGLVDELEKKTGSKLAQAIMHTPDSDRVAGRFAAEILKSRHPRLLLINFSAFDHAQHLSGPDSPEAKAALRNVDQVVGALAEAARAADPAAVVAVVSDHGFAPLHDDVNLLQAFADAGLARLNRDKSQFESWEAMPWGGATASVYLARPGDPDLQRKVRAFLTDLKKDPSFHIRDMADLTKTPAYAAGRAPAFRLGFEIGFEMGRDPAAPRVSPSRYRGMHGYPADYPEMRSAFFIQGGAVPKGRNLGTIRMESIAPTLATVMGLPATGDVLFKGDSTSPR